MKTFRHRRDHGVMIKGFQIKGNPIMNHENTEKLNDLLIDFIQDCIPVEITMRAIVDEDFNITDHSRNQHEYHLHVGNTKIYIEENDWIMLDWNGCVYVMTPKQISREFEETDEEYHLYDGITRFR